MKRRIASVSAKTIVGAIKAKKKKPDVRVTYTVDPDVAVPFTAACKRQGVKASQVVEELMRRFVEG